MLSRLLILLTGLGAPWALGMEDAPPASRHEPLQAIEVPLGDLGQWYVLDVLETRSAAGAAFTKLDDGSIIVSGESAVHDTYTITARTTLTGITAMRLDALMDDSLPNHGPGRARNGNFTITELSIAAAPLDRPQASQALALSTAGADYSQRDYEAAMAIDGDRATGWSIGTGGQDRWLVVTTAAPAAGPGGTLLTFTFHQDHPERRHYNLGRFRLSATTAHPPPPAVREPEFQPLLVQVGFAPVPIHTFTAASGATASPHERADHSVLIVGGQPINDTYTVELRTDLERITGLRIYALADDSLPQGGPGRTSQGIAINEVTVLAAPTDAPDNARPVPLHSPSATHAQRSMSIDRAMDGNEKSFWAAGERGRTLAAAFAFESPVTHEGGTVLTVSLRQRLAIGRLRLSLTTAREGHLIAVRPAAPAVPAAIENPPAADKPPPLERYYNVGGWPYADPRGHQWLPAPRWKEGRDGYLGGYAISSDVPMNPLLHRAVSGIDIFRATVPPGRYRVAMLFAEPRQDTAPGYRRFDVYIEGVKVVEALDPVRIAGGVGRTFLHVQPEVPVRDGVLDIEFFGKSPLLSAISIIGLED